jgi:hypothetical protein
MLKSCLDTKSRIFTKLTGDIGVIDSNKKYGTGEM